MKKFRKKFNLRLIKTSRSYYVQQIVKLLGVHKRTVHTWIKEGLQPNSDEKPYLIHGSTLKSFIKDRQDKRKSKCRSGEVFCLTCHKPRTLKDDSLEFCFINEIKLNVGGKCSECGNKLKRFTSPEKLIELLKTFKGQEQRISHLIETFNTSCTTHSKKEKERDEN